MQVQNDINPVMRGILVDWLVEVAEEYKLSAENLYLSTNYVDRFLSVVPVLASETLCARATPWVHGDVCLELKQGQLVPLSAVPLWCRAGAPAALLTHIHRRSK